jgi:multidrug resistance efflux pump
VQRVPIRIAVDDDPLKAALRSGMSVEVSIDTGQYRRVPQFFGSLLHLG